MSPVRRCPARPSNAGSGTLLITVLTVLAGLFIMAMMQYFAETVTRSRKVFHRETILSYMAESALQEAVVWFNSQANTYATGGTGGTAPGTAAPGGSAELGQLHELLSQGKLDEAAGKTVTYTPGTTLSKVFSGPDSAIGMETSSVELTPVEIRFAPSKVVTGPLGSTGLVYFKVTAKFLSDPKKAVGFRWTEKTLTRAYQFRQVNIAPKPVRDNILMISSFDYLHRRLKVYERDLQTFTNALEKVGEKATFSMAHLAYIVMPDFDTVPYDGSAIDPVDSSANNVGLKFAREVQRAAGGQFNANNQRLSGDLSLMKARFDKNENFNFSYLERMATADFSDFFKLVRDAIPPADKNSPPPALEDGKNDWPAAPEDLGQDICSKLPSESKCKGASGEACKKVECWTGRYTDKNKNTMPIRNWGQGAKPLTAPKGIEIKFKYAAEAGQETSDATFSRSAPSQIQGASLVVPNTVAQVVSSPGLQIRIVPPPVVSKRFQGTAAPGPSGTPPGTGTGSGTGPSAGDESSIDQISEEQIQKIPNEGVKTLVQLYKSIKDPGYNPQIPMDGEIRDLVRNAMGDDTFYNHEFEVEPPQARPDWAFRFDPAYYGTSPGSKFGQNVIDGWKRWKAKNKETVDWYDSAMEQQKAANGKTFETAVFTRAQPAKDWLAAVTAKVKPEDWSKSAATYVFKDGAQFKKALENPAGTGTTGSGLTLNGLYYIYEGDADLGAATYSGQGLVFADKVKAGQGIAPGGAPAGHLVLVGRDKQESVVAGGTLQAVVVMNSPPKDALKVKGVLLVDSVVCKKALEGGTDLQALDAKLAGTYNGDLPLFTVDKNPELVSAPEGSLSHMTLSPFRLASYLER